MSPLTPDLVTLLRANQQPVPKLLEELAEEQKRLVEFGEWENELDAAIKEGKTIEQLKEEEKEKEKEKDTVVKQSPSKPTDSEGNEIVADSNWTKFLNQTGTKQQRKKPKLLNERSKKKDAKAKSLEKKESLLHAEEEEIRGVKKIPLLKKQRK